MQLYKIQFITINKAMDTNDLQVFFFYCGNHTRSHQSSTPNDWHKKDGTVYLCK